MLPIAAHAARLVPGSYALKRPRTLGAKPRAVQLEQQRQYDRTRSRQRPWRSWYGLTIWKDIRRAQLAAVPYCERCEADGLVVEATVVNHKVRHNGDWQLFISGPFESICKPHHDSDVQREEREAARRERIQGVGQSRQG